MAESKDNPSALDTLSAIGRAITGVPELEPNTKDEEVVIAQETATDDENPTPLQPTQDQMDANRNFKFPLSIGSEYPARIIFRVIKIEGEDILAKLGIDKAIESVDAAFEFLGLTESKADETVDGETKKEIIEDSNKKQKELVSYQNNTGGETLGTITLPLQKALNYSDTADYESVQLGVIGAITEDGLQGRNALAGMSNADGSLQQAIGGLGAQLLAKSATGILGAAAGALSGGALGGGAVGAVLGDDINTGLAGAARGATRIASAPNSRSLFKSVVMRNFSFDFQMVANSPEEQKQIKAIVQMFRQELYPEKIAIGTSGVPLGYKFPNLFEIEVKNKFGQNPGFKIQRCYLENVTTTFNETSRGMYSDGQFIDVSVSVKFTEIVALDKQKVRLGY
jgi:hypothetical protein|tara:strand:+ start:4334 stop:5524 length:1191 start_codon:yes stop_codon:yes gene_type:complete